MLTMMFIAPVKLLLEIKSISVLVALCIYVTTIFCAVQWHEKTPHLDA
mgnify:FL=1